MIELSQAEIDDLRHLSDICERSRADLVIVGATAYKIHLPNKEHLTQDIDFAIALDLDDFEELCSKLKSSGWTQESNHEQRWRSPHGVLLDLLPAGSALREQKHVTWPGGFTMSLVGFDHVFSKALRVGITDTLSLRVIPLTVLMLLKIVAFMDRPHERTKDLFDIRDLLSEYETDSERIFSEAFAGGEIKEYSLANAFLLGRDLRVLCTEEEIEVVRQFVERVGDEDKPLWWQFVKASRQHSEQAEDTAREQLKTFSKALLA